MPKGYAQSSNVSVPLQPGTGYEGFFQGDWHPVEVLKVVKDLVQVKWEFDGSDSEVWKDYVRQAANKPKESAPAAHEPAPSVSQSTRPSEDRKKWHKDSAATDQKSWGTNDQKSWNTKAVSSKPGTVPVPQKNGPNSNTPLYPGAGYEAFCQGDYHSVEVLKVLKDTVMVKWGFDSSESEIWKHYVRQAAVAKSNDSQPSESAPPVLAQPTEAASYKPGTTPVPQKNGPNSKTPLHPGAGYEAFCQGDYHSVEVLKVLKDTVTVKWAFDGSESEIWKHYVRQAANKAKEAPAAVETKREPAPIIAPSTHVPDVKKQWNTDVARDKTHSSDVRKQWNTDVAVDKKSWDAKVKEVNHRNNASTSKTVPQQKEQSSTNNAPVQPGVGYEAFCQGEFYSVEVLKVLTKDTVQVKWGFDGSEAEIWTSWVRRQAQVAVAKPPPPVLGQKLDAKCNDHQSHMTSTVEATDEPSSQIMDAAVAKKVLRWLPKDAPKDVRNYFASLAECPVSSFGGC